MRTGKFCQKGKESFQDDTLHFFENFKDSQDYQKADVIFTSSTLQYLRDPYEWIKSLKQYNVPYLVLDLIPVKRGTQDRICVQKVPPSIYKASYPARFMAESNLLNALKKDYDLITDFPGYVSDHLTLNDGYVADYKGYLLKKKGLL